MDSLKLMSGHWMKKLTSMNINNKLHLDLEDLDAFSKLTDYQLTKLFMMTHLEIKVRYWDYLNKWVYSTLKYPPGADQIMRDTMDDLKYLHEDPEFDTPLILFLYTACYIRMQRYLNLIDSSGRLSEEEKGFENYLLTLEIYDHVKDEPPFLEEYLEIFGPDIAEYIRLTGYDAPVTFANMHSQVELLVVKLRRLQTYEGY